MSDDALNSARLHLSEAAELAGTMAGGYAMKKLTRALNRCNPLSVNPRGPQGYAENSFEGGNVGAPPQSPQYSVGSYPEGHAVEANFPPPLPVTEYPGDTIPPAMPDPCQGMKSLLAACAPPSTYAAGHKPPGPGGGQFTSGGGGSGSLSGPSQPSHLPKAGSNRARGKITTVNLNGQSVPSATVVDLPDFSLGGNHKDSSTLLGDFVHKSFLGVEGSLVHIDPDGKSITLRTRDGQFVTLDPNDTNTRDAELGKFKGPTQNAAYPYCPSFMGQPTGEVRPLTGSSQPLDTYESFTNQPGPIDPSRSLNDTLRQLWLRNAVQQSAQMPYAQGHKPSQPTQNSADYSYPKNPDGRAQGPMTAIPEGDFLGGRFGPGIHKMREQLRNCRSR